MTATEMHDLLLAAYRHIAHDGALFRPGDGEFSHVLYCRFCRYAEGWVATHGHGENCLYDRLKRATQSENDND